MMFTPLTKIVSGGQTGADRGALNAARALSLPIGGWAPQGWRAEDGRIPLELRQFMRESVSPNYGLRTRLNVQDSDGTLILSFASTLTGGSKFTVDQVKQQRKPCKHLVLPRGSGVVPGEVTAALWDWIDEKKIAVLNVAGPRESKERGIQESAYRVVRGLLTAKHHAFVRAQLGYSDAVADAVNTRSLRDEAPAFFSALKKPEDRARQEEADRSAFWAYAGAELAAANKAADRKDEIFASGKYREAGGPMQGLMGLVPTPQDGSQVAPLRDVSVPIPCAKCGTPSIIHLGAGMCETCDPPLDPDEENGKWDCHLDEPPPCPMCKAEDPQYHAEWCLLRAGRLQEFLDDCSRATTAEEFNRDNTGLIDRYYAMDGNGAGGSLHVVLDDGNYERSTVEFCRDYAIEDGDKAGEALARALLALPDDVYNVVLPGPTYCGTCCQDYNEVGQCKCVLHPVQAEGGADV